MEDKDEEKKPSAFERRIKLLKLLQGTEMRIGEIAEKFDVDDRTIRSDIKALREMEVFDTKVKVESSHVGSQAHYYTSTVHPIFLALNLSELVALLQVLEREAMSSHHEIYGILCGTMLQKIYNQLTDYGEGKIKHTLLKEYVKGKTINTLEEEVYKNIPYMIKSGTECKITYTDENEMEITEKVKWKRVDGSKVLAKNSEGKERWLVYDDIKINWDEISYK